MIPFLSLDILRINQVSPRNRFTEISPELRLQGSQRHVPSIFRFVNMITSISPRQEHFSSLRKFSIHKIFSRVNGKPGDDPIQHGDIEMLPFSCFSPVDDCCKNGKGSHHSS